MAIQIEKIIIKDFKKIENLEIDLSPITAFVGGNTSGKSSVLQATQLCISLLQASFRGRRRNGVPDFLGSVSDDAVSFRPTERLLDLRRGRAATQTSGFDIGFVGRLDAGVDRSFTLNVKRGKNANISLKIDGDADFAAMLAESVNGSSVFTPGLSGISTREELRTRGALSSGVMQGDANTYIRSLLYHLYNSENGYDEADDRWTKADWNYSEISELPDCDWKSFCILLSSIYNGARIHINHDEEIDRFIDIEISYEGGSAPLDLASTGMLQVIQIIAYACYFQPPLLLLDEPDAHLHADSQQKLFFALKGLTETTHTRILLASHSPQLLQRIHNQDFATVCWMENGARVELDKKNLPSVPLLMNLGALGIGSEIFNAERRLFLLTEDTITDYVKTYAISNGYGEDVVLISYGGCGNLSGARTLASLIKDARQDTKVIIHRDRDFRTKEELDFEILRFNKFLEESSLEGVYEVFTKGNDIEHGFCNENHLMQIFAELDAQAVSEILYSAIERRRDEQVSKLDGARDALKNSLYDSPRLRKSPAWVAAAMPNNCLMGKKFRPQDNLTPYPLSSCHGKTLFHCLIAVLHERLNGSIDDIYARINQPSESLKDDFWQAPIT